MAVSSFAYKSWLQAKMMPVLSLQCLVDTDWLNLKCHRDAAFRLSWDTSLLFCCELLSSHSDER
ncbi:hypothetical protein E2C01_002312 [Portunus trituberculatus]|uniref:Uncharacterized protein n=1 Tax=Portunus trituberculatus TaxID=210409 RepID=A0A5B7CK91_PORTR|nr:hypothetical protein [Portunus trituberculatus]